MLRSPIPTTPVPSSSSSSSPKQANSVEKLDQAVLMSQLKYFTDKCTYLAAEKSLLVLNATIDKDELKKEIERIKSESETEKSEMFRELERIKSESETEKSKMFRELASALDPELNCSICKEIYIQVRRLDVNQRSIFQVAF